MFIRVCTCVYAMYGSFKMEPSPANIALKPKDCEDVWNDAHQKCLFRFQAFYGQVRERR